MIRYADDMVITGRSEEMLQKSKEINYLKIRGLQLNEKKTKTTNIKDGFYFLGFNVKRMERRLKFNGIDEQNTVLVIKPSEKGINKFKDSIRRIIIRTRPFLGIVKEINPVIRG